MTVPIHHFGLPRDAASRLRDYRTPCALLLLQAVVLIAAQVTRADSPAGDNNAKHLNQTCTAEFVSHVQRAAANQSMTLGNQATQPLANPADPVLNAERSNAQCDRHPWLRQLQHWVRTGMTLESALQWRISPPDLDTDPLLVGDLADLARMQAAYTLAKSGLADEAHPIWLDLSLRRSDWAEVWFNLGLSAWLTGQPDAGHHLQHAMQLCRERTCAIPANVLQEWLARTGVQP